LPRWGDFLVTPENRFAVRSAQRVLKALRSDSRRVAFACPLYWHGTHGTGKTALANELLSQVAMLGSTKLVRTVALAEWPRDQKALTELQGLDLLLIEGVHQLKKPDVNSLAQLLDGRTKHRKMTILTGSTGPANLPNVPRRLCSRLAGGLLLRMEAPGLQSRKMLVREFAKARRLKLSTEAVAWLAAHTTGYRTIVGKLETLRTGRKLSAVALTALQVKETLAKSTQNSQPREVLQGIVGRVAELYGVKSKELLGASRVRAILVPRQVAMFVAQRFAKCSYAEIGRYFGGRDHTTVINAVKKIVELKKHDHQLAATLRELADGW
jgi:chromosomal replication initiator protein